MRASHCSSARTAQPVMPAELCGASVFLRGLNHPGWGTLLHVCRGHRVVSAATAASSSRDGRDAVELVRDEDERVALAELVLPLQPPVGLERRKHAAFKVPLRVGQHHVNGDERAGVVMVRVRQGAAGLDGMVLDTSYSQRRRRPLQHAPVARAVGSAACVDEPLAQPPHGARC